MMEEKPTLSRLKKLYVNDRKEFEKIAEYYKKNDELFYERTIKSVISNDKRNQKILFGVVISLILFFAIGYLIKNAGGPDTFDQKTQEQLFKDNYDKEKREREDYERRNPKTTDEIKKEAEQENEQRRKVFLENEKRFNEMDYETRKKIDPNTTKKKSEYSKEEYLKMYDQEGLEKDKNDNPVKK